MLSMQKENQFTVELNGNLADRFSLLILKCQNPYIWIIFQLPIKIKTFMINHYVKMSAPPNILVLIGNYGNKLVKYKKKVGGKIKVGKKRKKKEILLL